MSQSHCTVLVRVYVLWPFRANHGLDIASNQIYSRVNELYLI